jgi:hypothetical protein
MIQFKDEKIDGIGECEEESGNGEEDEMGRKRSKRWLRSCKEKVAIWKGGKERRDKNE